MQAEIQQAVSPDARSSNSTVHSVINVVRDLTSVMSREVELLRAMQIREFGALQGEKLSLINTYETETAALRAEYPATESLDERLREELRDVVQRMTDTMRENEAAIRAAKTTNEKLVGAITRAVQSAQNSHVGYSDRGLNRSGGTVSLRVDQQL